jgi:hypothetical protein
MNLLEKAVKKADKVVKSRQNAAIYGKIALNREVDLGLATGRGKAGSIPVHQDPSSAV